MPVYAASAHPYPQKYFSSTNNAFVMHFLWVIGSTKNRKGQVHLCLCAFVWMCANKYNNLVEQEQHGFIIFKHRMWTHRWYITNSCQVRRWSAVITVSHSGVRMNYCDCKKWLVDNFYLLALDWMDHWLITNCTFRWPNGNFSYQ